MESHWVKICGLTQPEQAIAVARQGADAIGFIRAPTSPRYVTLDQLQRMSQGLIDNGYASVERVGVFVDADDPAIAAAIAAGQLTTLQLHGQESPGRCQDLRLRHPEVRLIKALRVRSPAVLHTIPTYEAVVDALLLDAYHPQEFGGTGNTLDWPTLKAFCPPVALDFGGGDSPRRT